MLINTPVSLGELMDKVSILKIKKNKIKDINKLIYISEELELLEEVLKKSVDNNKINKYLNILIKINTDLWEIEDDIRDCERNKKFDQNFIKLARAVYVTNDQRSKIKLEINNYFGSKIIEVKSYEEY